MRDKLSLDIDTILKINEALARRLDIDSASSLEELHGSFTVSIVKGRFQVVQVTASDLLIENNSKRHKRTA